MSDTTAAGHAAAVRHPLDPLNAEEFRNAAGILRRDKEVDERWRFASIELKEPSKHSLQEFSPGDPIKREAIVVCWNRDDGQAYKSIVSLTEDSVVSWEHRPGEQPNATVDEWHECDVALHEDPRVAEILAERGITNLDLVLFDVWAYGGALVPEQYSDRRVGWVDVWRRDAEDSNPYANPVAGLHFIVDLNSMEVLEVEDSFRVEEPEVMGEYVPKHLPDMTQREIKPLEITQPEGVSFSLDGYELKWQKWSMRVGLQLPRRPRAPYRWLRGRRKGAARGAPDVVRGDDRTVPRPYGRPLPSHGVRYRRVGPGFHDDFSRTRL